MVVRKLTDDFDAPFKGFVVGLRPNKSRQEGVVDVDGVMGMPMAKFLRQDLHVPASTTIHQDAMQEGKKKSSQVWANAAFSGRN